MCKVHACLYMYNVLLSQEVLGLLQVSLEYSVIVCHLIHLASPHQAWAVHQSDREGGDASRYHFAGLVSHASLSEYHGRIIIVSVGST